MRRSKLSVPKDEWWPAQTLRTELPSLSGAVLVEMTVVAHAPEPVAHAAGSPRRPCRSGQGSSDFSKVLVSIDDLKLVPGITTYTRLSMSVLGAGMR